MMRFASASNFHISITDYLFSVVQSTLLAVGSSEVSSIDGQ
jgi:hypothetical protein